MNFFYYIHYEKTNEITQIIKIDVKTGVKEIYAQWESLELEQWDNLVELVRKLNENRV